MRGQFTPSWDESYYALYPSSFKNYPSIIINDLNISLGRQEPKFKLIFKQEINSFLSPSDTPDFPNDQVINLPYSFDFSFLQTFWDKISLTPLEDAVVRIVKESIEPRLIRLDISGGKVKVRLEGESKPLPLSVLGDGVQRVLLIALALVNAKNEVEGQEGKIVLIDELESGLHFSVQEKLWELIFEYANSWKIQFFITTHNRDTINTFYYVANEERNLGKGFLFRLQYNRERKLEAIPYNMERLEDALEMNIEIR